MPRRHRPCRWAHAAPGRSGPPAATGTAPGPAPACFPAGRGTSSAGCAALRWPCSRPAATHRPAAMPAPAPPATDRAISAGRPRRSPPRHRLRVPHADGAAGQAHEVLLAEVAQLARDLVERRHGVHAHEVVAILGQRMQAVPVTGEHPGHQLHALRHAAHALDVGQCPAQQGRDARILRADEQRARGAPRRASPVARRGSPCPRTAAPACRWPRSPGPGTPRRR